MDVDYLMLIYKKIMKAKETPNSNNMCHSYVLLAFPNCTLFSSCTRQVGATQYRGYDMGRKAEDWGFDCQRGSDFSLHSDIFCRILVLSIGYSQIFLARKATGA